MYYSKSATDAGVSARVSATPEILVSPSPSDESTNNYSVHSNHQIPGPSAPLLPHYSENTVLQSLEPPPYSSVVAQDSGDWKHRSSSFSGIINHQPRPTAPSSQNHTRSEHNLDNPPPYPTDGGAASGPPYSMGMSSMPLPGSIENPGRLGEVEEVITVQPKLAEMNVRDAMQEDSSLEDEESKKRRRLATTQLNTVNTVNTNASRSNNSDTCCLDCCFVVQVPVSNGHFGGHDSCCCFDDSSDGCCNGDSSGDGCNGDSSGSCCADGCSDDCCDAGCFDDSCID